jgi:aspartate carbamoyltransferase catalytic subunit
MPLQFRHKHILGLDMMSDRDIETILEVAARFKQLFGPPPVIKKVPALRNIMICLAFFEPSTRTRLSFEAAAKRLSSDMMNFTAATSSLTKGETLRDTCLNLQALGPSVIVMRHKSSGAPHFVAANTDMRVINGGDGWHEHPSQALLDMFTMKERKGRIKGLKVAILGDITHSRVAHSNIFGLTKMGAEVHVCGPRTMIPKDIERLGVKVQSNPKDAIKDADVVMGLRIQLERMEKNLFPSNQEYWQFFGINKDVIKCAKKDYILMHPGPMNRGVEIDHELADGPSSVILDQVTNGIAVRMALLYLVTGGNIDAEALT